ncbi:hypothetical protein HJG60_010223 [Phyllostomus discolor]|uniref:Uncharacterized protein n=1 Tax=Phyllostomus discolor TaxID=89673 RepID=A0A834AXZ7_9CHIR|nr:hypothetical protein HJG60_010223 [Phyllostomus discolor]
MFKRFVGQLGAGEPRARQTRSRRVLRGGPEGRLPKRRLLTRRAAAGRRGSLLGGSGRRVRTGGLVILGKKVLRLPRRPAPQDMGQGAVGRGARAGPGVQRPVSAAQARGRGSCPGVRPLPSQPGVGFPGTLGRLQCSPVHSSSPAGVGGVNLNLPSKRPRGRVGVGVGGRISPSA